MAMTIEQVRDRLASWYGGSEACLDVKACAELGDMIAALDAHLTQPAQAVDAAMVERALTYRARQEDGAIWPDAYGAEEQAAEREQMRAMLSEALNPNGPKAYCRSCQRAGMSNCGYFDECTGATCITCHRPFVDARALSGEKAGPVGDGWQPIETAPKDGTHIWLGATHEMRVGFWHQSWEHWVDYHAAESGSPRSLRFDPTVWQPLPATPDKEGA